MCALNEKTMSFPIHNHHNPSCFLYNNKKTAISYDKINNFIYHKEIEDFIIYVQSKCAA